MDADGKEFTAQDIFDVFEREYGLQSIPAPSRRVLKEIDTGPKGSVRFSAEILLDEVNLVIDGTGNGPIDAFVQGLARACGENLRVLDYHEHAIGDGANAQAIAYLELQIGERVLFGVGTDSDIVSASLKAIVSGLWRARLSRRELSIQAT
jgi:2-isopropylmalate synthase